MAAPSGVIALSRFVKRSSSNNNKPAKVKRDAPVQIGGQVVTMNLVPVLVPPHRKTAKSKLNVKAAFVLERTQRKVEAMKSLSGGVLECHDVERVLEKRAGSSPILQLSHTP